MSSEPTFYTLILEQPPVENAPSSSFIAEFDQSVVDSGEFMFSHIDGNANANAFATIFSFSTPGGSYGFALATIPGTTTSLSGTLTPTSYPITVKLQVMDPVTGAVDTAATVPANSNSNATISWTATSSTVKPRTRAETAHYIKRRRKSAH